MDVSWWVRQDASTSIHFRYQSLPMVDFQNPIEIAKDYREYNFYTCLLVVERILNMSF